MGKRIDLTGKTFGWLKVLGYSHTEKNRAYWKCICEVCGKEPTLSSLVLRSGSNVSCGCMRNCTNITNQQFGKLKAVKPLNKMDGDSRVWLFECDCGSSCETSYASVKWSGKTSCGCAIAPSQLANIAKALESVAWVDNTNVNKLKSDKLQINNTSGVKGVNWHKDTQRWVARIMFKKKTYELGYYKDFDEAVKARKNAEQVTHEAFVEWYEKYKGNLDDAPESPDGTELEKIK